MRFGLILAGSALGAMALAAAASARPALPTDASSPTFTGHRFAGEAKVSLPEARRIALQARTGAITDEELERERGGSGLRYSFDVKSGAHTFEVGVDAKTGKVLENDSEGAHPD